MVTSGNVFGSLLAPQGRYMWSGERLTKVQTTTRPDHGCLEVWTQIDEATQKREKQEWANEKPKLENTRRTTGSYFIDPEDEEYEETIKNARKKLEVHLNAAIPCEKKTKSLTCSQETVARLDASNKVPTTKCA